MSDVVVTFEQSPTLGSFAEALAAAQAEIGNAAADSANPHFKSAYADLASVRDASRPLSKHKIAVTQQVTTREGEVGVRTMLIHASGEWMASTAYLKPDKPGPQAAGSVITYLRRYMLAAALGIAQADDDAEGATERKPPRSVSSHGHDRAAATGEIVSPVRAGAQGGSTGMVSGGPGSAGPAPSTPAPPPASARLSPVTLAAVRKALDGVIPVPRPGEPSAPENVEPIKKRIAYVAWACGHWMETSLAELTAAQAEMVIVRAKAGEMPPKKGKAA